MFSSVFPQQVDFAIHMMLPSRKQSTLAGSIYTPQSRAPRPTPRRKKRFETQFIGDNRFSDVPKSVRTLERLSPSPVSPPASGMQPHLTERVGKKSTTQIAKKEEVTHRRILFSIFTSHHSVLPPRPRLSLIAHCITFQGKKQCWDM